MGKCAAARNVVYGIGWPDRNLPGSTSVKAHGHGKYPSVGQTPCGPANGDTAAKETPKTKDQGKVGESDLQVKTAPTRNTDDVRRRNDMCYLYGYSG